MVNVRLAYYCNYHSIYKKEKDFEIVKKYLKCKYGGQKK